MFTIRKATIDDRSLIHDLASRIWENTYGKILSKEQLDYMFDMMYAPDNILTIFKRSIPYRKCMARESGVLSSNKVLTI